MDSSVPVNVLSSESLIELLEEVQSALKVQCNNMQFVINNLHSKLLKKEASNE